MLRVVYYIAFGVLHVDSLKDVKIITRSKAFQLLTWSLPIHAFVKYRANDYVCYVGEKASKNRDMGDK